MVPVDLIMDVRPGQRRRGIGRCADGANSKNANCSPSAGVRENARVVRRVISEVGGKAAEDVLASILAIAGRWPPYARHRAVIHRRRLRLETARPASRLTSPPSSSLRVASASPL